MCSAPCTSTRTSPSACRLRRRWRPPDRGGTLQACPHRGRASAERGRSASPARRGAGPAEGRCSPLSLQVEDAMVGPGNGSCRCSAKEHQRRMRSQQPEGSLQFIRGLILIWLNGTSAHMGHFSAKMVACKMQC